MPRASQDAVVDRQEGIYRLRITAAPVEGRANSALKAFMARCLGVPKVSVRIVAGDRSRIKTVEIEGLSQEEAEGLLDTRLLGHAGKNLSEKI